MLPGGQSERLGSDAARSPGGALCTHFHNRPPGASRSRTLQCAIGVLDVHGDGAVTFDRESGSDQHRPSVGPAVGHVLGMEAVGLGMALSTEDLAALDQLLDTGSPHSVLRRGDWPDFGSTDLAWASASMHHMTRVIEVGLHGAYALFHAAGARLCAQVLEVSGGRVDSGDVCFGEADEQGEGARARAAPRSTIWRVPAFSGSQAAVEAMSSARASASRSRISAWPSVLCSWCRPCWASWWGMSGCTCGHSQTP